MLDVGNGSLQDKIQGLRQWKSPSLQLVQFSEILDCCTEGPLWLTGLVVAQAREASCKYGFLWELAGCREELPA